MDDSNIWERVLARVETKVNQHTFYSWFKATPFSWTTTARRVAGPRR